MTRSLRTAAALPVLVVTLLAAGCGSAKKDDPILRLSAAESLVEGKRLFERERFAAARPYFAHAFEVEPNSAAGREALLLVADTLFLEGGSTNLIQAEAKYRDFMNRFPTSDKGPYVQSQIAAALGRRIERPDRDQAATVKALEAYRDLIRLYPTSPFADAARGEIAKVEDRLAEHEYMVGRFYLRYRLPPAAIGRFEKLLEDYPGYSGRDRTLYHLGVAYRAARRADDAQATFSKLREQFPDSEWTAKIPEVKR
jgi:outer membrane protein assembly factor BamD